MNAPANQQIARSDEKFQVAIQGELYQHKFKAMLPPDVSVERFTAVVLRAVQENPDLLKESTDKPSLFLSCQRAAQDGLLPDKREGALVMYGNKVQWQPMIGGLRKKLAENRYSLRAEVVHEHDVFDYDLGDDPKITHKAPPLGQDRGKVIGAYAIATHMDTGEKYREIMDLNALNAVEAVSRSGASGPWKGPFRTEMQRKTVAKRLMKSLPIDDRRLQEIIDRDNEQYDLSNTPKREPSPAAGKVQAAVRDQVGKPAPAAREQPEAVVEGEFTESADSRDAGDFTAPSGADF